MELRVLGGITDVVPAAWNALVGDGSPFLEWEFLHACEASGAASRRTGWRPRHLTIWQGDALVAACPLYVKGHSLGEFVFDQSWAAAAERAGIPYYPKLLVGVPFTPVTGARFLTRAADRPALVAALATALEELAAAEDVSSVHVNFCLPDEVEALAGRGWLRRVGYQYHWRNAGFAGFDDYLASLRSKRRNQVRRERQALGEAGIEIETLAGDAVPDELFGTMYRLYRRTVDRLPWGQRYLNPRFFELARDRLRDRLCLVVARRRGEVVAATFNVVKAGVFYGRYWGTHEDVRHLHFNVCYYAAIEHCIARGLGRFEPGAGGDFKQLRGFEPAVTTSMHLLREPRLRAAVRDFLARERRAVAHEMEWLDERTALRRDRGPG
jgi:predicted N-acyltransferase